MSAAFVCTFHGHWCDEFPVCVSGLVPLPDCLLTE